MNEPFSIQAMKWIDIVEYLEKLGHQPRKARNNDYWYLSSFREEKEPSFKVKRQLNVWYDHGLGPVESPIDFGTLYYNCSIKEVLLKRSTSLSFHPQTLTIQQPEANTQKAQEALEPKIKAIAAKPLTISALCRYKTAGKIPSEIVKKYCREVDFELPNKRYFAIGFENKYGGFELKKERFIGSISPKNVTQISTSESKEMSVFGCFFSFLSYHIPQQKNNLSLTIILILNSHSFFEKSRELMEKSGKVFLYLDKDEVGMKNSRNALKCGMKYTDKSHLYKNHNDLNDYLVHQNQPHIQRFKLRRHF